MIRDFIVDLYGETIYNALAYFFSFYPLWLPITLGIVFWELWLRYIRHLFFSKTQTTLLEIKMPRDITKSPVAMEIALTALHQLGGEGTFIDRYWEGKVRAWFSLEIISIGGDVRFLIWTRTNMRNIIESQLYSQYPTIEIREVEDYTMPFSYKPDGDIDVWGTHFILANKDAYPIKTYVDYGLDKDPKEEFKNDPITSVLEYLGSLKEGEQAWVQIVVRAHKKEKRGGIFSSASDWREPAQQEIKDIQAKIKAEMRNVPTEGEREKISGIERSMGKFPFDTGIRVVYVAPRDVFSQSSINGLRGIFRPFNSNNLNGFKLDNSTNFDYPWQDLNGVRMNRKKRKMLDAYKRRMFFYAPHRFKPFILTNEELATMYHFPGQVAAVPGLTRIPSKKAQPPQNLPM